MARKPDPNNPLYIKYLKQREERKSDPRYIELCRLCDELKERNRIDRLRLEHDELMMELATKPPLTADEEKRLEREWREFEDMKLERSFNRIFGWILEEGELNHMMKFDGDVKVAGDPIVVMEPYADLAPENDEVLNTRGFKTNTKRLFDTLISTDDPPAKKNRPPPSGRASSSGATEPQ